MKWPHWLSPINYIVFLIITISCTTGSNCSCGLFFSSSLSSTSPQPAKTPTALIASKTPTSAKHALQDSDLPKIAVTAATIQTVQHANSLKISARIAKPDIEPFKEDAKLAKCSTVRIVQLQSPTVSNAKRASRWPLKVAPQKHWFR